MAIILLTAPSGGGVQIHASDGRRSGDYSGTRHMDTSQACKYMRGRPAQRQVGICQHKQRKQGRRFKQRLGSGQSRYKLGSPARRRPAAGSEQPPN